MPSSTDTHAFSKLASSLETGLPGANLSEVAVGDGLLPLLIVQAGHLVAAFAMGEDEESYDALYPAFKKYFMSRNAEWSAKDVSFVYCLPPSHEPSEEFCSRVEVDVYFCRKFVVQLTDHIDASLVRLPFLPLSPVAGQSLRPPSAQTFLQGLGVKAELARNIVLPGRSAATIVADCLAGKFGEPKLEAQPRVMAAAGSSAASPKGQSTLKSLAIQNFRAYRTEREFELGAAVTVLYGPNGFGKTSFFDALDFAATGGIGRLSRAGTAVARAARHLDCGPDEKSSVTLKFVQGGETHSLTRDLSDMNKATLDGRPGVERKELLGILTGADTPPADRVDNLVSLFRATHLFSQENQALTAGFTDSCEVSGELVSRMLAFEDYVSGIKKATDVRDTMSGAMSRAASEARRLREQAAADSLELARLSTLASSGIDTAGVDSSVAELNNGAHALGLDAKVSANAEELRGLRLQLEERLGTLDTHRARLTACASTVAARRACAEETGKAREQSTEFEAAAEKAADAHLKAMADAQEASAKGASAAADVAAARARLEAIAWAVETKPQFDKLNTEQRDLAAQHDAASKDRDAMGASVAAAAASEAAASSAHQVAGTNAAASAASVENLSQVMKRVGELRGTYSALSQLRVQIGTTKDAVARHEQRLKELRQSEAEAQGRIGPLEQAVAQVQGQESALKALVSQLRAHVADGKCLLCAHEHGSKEALLHAIDVNAAQNPALPELTAQLARQREAKHSAEHQAREEVTKLSSAQSQLTAARKELDRLEAAVAAVAELLSRLGIQFSGQEGELAVAEGQLQELLAAELERQRGLVAETRDCAKRLQEARTAHASEASKRGDAEILVKRLEAALATTRQALDRISTDIRASQNSLASSSSELGALQAAELQRLRTHQAAHEAARATQEQATRLQKEAEARASAARAAARQAAGRRAATEERLKALGRSLAEAGFSEDASESDVDAALVQHATQTRTVESLREKAQALEIALDAVATAAAMQSIKARVVEYEAKAAAADETANKHRPWEEYFGRLADLLREQQRDATKHFTDEYGPRTAVIQRRLRPVYGFGEIEVSSRGSNIAVRVKRNGEAHKPSEFFSQSQVQTLLLGLFLTACSSQTWSGFSSIMLDDPVTHFDDMNTYALLDLLSGLLRPQDGERQFVISTCDEKLLQLARQKFRHLGPAAKFYRFSAIGADGPMVSEIPA
jgi:exonuclease SbcC